MWFAIGTLSLGGLVVARLQNVSLDFISHNHWTLTALASWEYRPSFLSGVETFQLLIPVESGHLHATVSAQTGTSSGCGDGEPVSLKGETQLWNSEF